MSDFLAAAVAQARLRAARAAQLVPLERLRAGARAIPRPGALAAALGGDGCAVVAEIKRASPSRGALAAITDPAALAGAYARGGAAAVSVLTVPEHFGGALEDLGTAAAAVSLPVLRKDFIVDVYQVWEARAAGAAAVLLIVAALDDRGLRALLRAADAAGLDALVEVHDAPQVRRAVAAAEATDGSGRRDRRLLLGVNARNLSSLEIDPGRFEKLRAELPEEAIAVAESAVAGPDDVRRLAGVGESCVRAADPAGHVRRLVEAGLR
ncbi:MAG TPA: hypothetical protein VG452_02640, partial [Egibacteraceae bacterium]|nr:hypothetical protein [Egibacteraceae bacterium]